MVRQQCSMLWSASFHCFQCALESKEYSSDRLAVGPHGGNFKIVHSSCMKISPMWVVNLNINILIMISLCLKKLVSEIKRRD